jgi:hypothetical protein
MVDFNAMQDALVQCDRGKLEGLVNGAMAEGTPALYELPQRGSRR